jgi:hypothetical protein
MTVTDAHLWLISNTFTGQLGPASRLDISLHSGHTVIPLFESLNVHLHHSLPVWKSMICDIRLVGSHQS